ncbi:MAG: GNAT family N-acetyltransferase [Parvularculaceae bacterium]
MGRKVDVTITYLEQASRPILPTPVRPSGKTAIMRAENPPNSFYRYLYRLVGDPHYWMSRRKLSDGELSRIICDPKVFIYVLYVGGVPAGMGEVDARNAAAAELKFFGVAPSYQTKGLGRFFLTHVIDLAWALGVTKLRLETCTLDHPAALPLYQKLGFSVFDQQIGQVELLDD